MNKAFIVFLIPVAFLFGWGQIAAAAGEIESDVVKDSVMKDSWEKSTLYFISVEVVINDDYTAEEVVLDVIARHKIRPEFFRFRDRGEYGNYELKALDQNNNVIWRERFDVYFDYAGPKLIGVDYSDIRYENVWHSTKVPFDARMEKLELLHLPTGQIIFSKELLQDQIQRLKETAAIKGRVVDHQGNPVNEARIDFSEELTECVGSVFTDKKGNYIIDLYELGQAHKAVKGDYRFVLWIYPPLNLKQVFKEELVKRGETKLLNIALRQCGSIAGTITDKEGNPLTEAWVHEVGFSKPRYSVLESGRFVIPNLDPGTYKIDAFVKVAEEHIKLTPKEIKVKLGETAVVNFVLEE